MAEFDPVKSVTTEPRLAQLHRLYQQWKEKRRQRGYWGRHLFSRKQFITTMDPLTFFAGMQALAAFLQVWQTERKAKSAAAAYFRAKEEAMGNPDVQLRAEELNRLFSAQPKFARLIKNRMGQCEDKWEDELRELSEDAVNLAAQAFVRCQCLILQAVRTANGGKLSPSHQAVWDRLECDAVLRDK